MARPFFTYMLRCADGSYYVGHTDDVERRMTQHEIGAGSAYTARCIILAAQLKRWLHAAIIYISVSPSSAERGGLNSLTPSSLITNLLLRQILDELYQPGMI
jgi:hypothetical protein